MTDVLPVAVSVRPVAVFRLCFVRWKKMTKWEELEILRQLLAGLLSDEDKRYYQIKYGIDLGV